MPRNYFTIIPAVYLILEKDNQILLLRRYNTGYNDGLYSLPSGHVEDGEFPIDALIREAQEEIGINLKKEDLQLVHTMYRRQSAESTRVDFYIVAKEWSNTISNMEPHKCDDLSWVSYEALPDTVIPVVKQAIMAYREGVIYSEASM